MHSVYCPAAFLAILKPVRPATEKRRRTTADQDTVRLPATFGLREASWSAVAACRGEAQRRLERSDDTAFHVSATSKSGVPLRFPPQSKTVGCGRHRSSGAFRIKEKNQTSVLKTQHGQFLRAVRAEHQNAFDVAGAAGAGDE